MQYETIKNLINPYNKQKLSYKHENGTEYLMDETGNKIPIRDGIPDFLVLENTDGLNLKYRRFYDKISRLNDFAEFIYSLFYDLKRLRHRWMKDVEVKENWNVLETSAGTGWNFRVLPVYASYYGIDISRGMLKKAQRNEQKWNRPMQLFQANAEYLPFADKTFDSVFHVGGINFFNDRKRAIAEMVRVAKPDTKIVIIDETEERIRKQYQKTPFIRKYFLQKDIDYSKTAAPVELIPSGMKEVEVKLIDNGRMYQLSFRTT